MPGTKPKIIALLAVIVIALFFVNFGAGQKKDVTDGATAIKNPLNTRNYWLAQINDLGAAKAYEKFKETYAEENFGTQHSLAHVIGELIYEKEGIPGLAICDATFAFGCYHSFFGRALSEQGLEVIPELDKTCVEKFGPLGTGCLHGIGHGIREFMGPDRLVDALDACTLTTQIKELFGCTSGVFMENNVPIVITDDAEPYTAARKLNSENPYEPCNTIVPEKFRKSCYYEMPQWWNQVFNFDYSKVGELCAGIPDAEQSKSCFLGAGNVAAPSSQYNVAQTIKLCDLMPSEEGVLLCRSGASWSFFAEPTARNLSPELCKGLGPEVESQCAKESDLIGNGEKNGVPQ